MSSRQILGAKMRVIIADDHPVVLVGLKAWLHTYGGRFAVVGEATNSKDLSSILTSVPCDLLITDFSMPGDGTSEDGLSMLRQLRAAYPALPIIVLTMLRNPAVIRQMTRLGVRGMVDKMSMTRELLLVIDAVCAGHTYLSDSFRKQMDNTGRSADEQVSVSPREGEVIRFIARGMTVSEIARRTGRSVKTISQQKRDAMRKLGLETDKQLFDYVRSIGLL